jgi:putative drug exporter of the RND superfamily
VFAALGRFSVRYRYAILAFWVVATALAVTFLPSLSSVAKNDDSQFLGSGAPSVRAARLASSFQKENVDTLVVVAYRRAAPLTSADQAAFNQIEAAISHVRLVTAVRDRGVSGDGEARRALVETSVRTTKVPDATRRTVDSVRTVVSKTGSAPGLSVYVTGELAVNVDQARTTSHQQHSTELYSILFIVVLLLLVFRSALAPLVTLAPAALALVLAGPLIAEVSKAGVEVSDLTQFMLIVLMLGAGTDYGLFLIFRVREEMTRGQSPRDAVSHSLARVGESITFSATTVIAAFLTLIIATFGLYRGLGPGLAIGIAIVLIVDLTLLPALLAIFGRTVFWPTTPRPGKRGGGLWGRVCARVVRRPGATLAVGLVVFGGLSLANLAYAPAGFDTNTTAPPGSPSALGERVLNGHFPATQAEPTVVVFRLERSAWDDPQLLALAQAELSREGTFSLVDGALNPNGTRLDPATLGELHSRLGDPLTLGAVAPPGSPVAPALFEAYRATGQFVSPDGRTVQYYTTLAAGAPTSDGALQAIPAVRQVVSDTGRTIGATESGVAGQVASRYDVSAASSTDLHKIIPIVLVVIAFLLVLLLRSLVAPAYLILSVGISYLAALGFSVLVFVIIGGADGINFALPFFMFVFLMALGEDYNILVMSRIREEAHGMRLREAVATALDTTGTTVTSAGLILAGTFLVLTVATSGSVRQIGIGLASGVLLDTFLVRTLLVPSAVVLIGRYNWWPSRLCQETVAPQETAGAGEEVDVEAQRDRELVSP